MVESLYNKMVSNGAIIVTRNTLRHLIKFRLFFGVLVVEEFIIRLCR